MTAEAQPSGKRRVYAARVPAEQRRIELLDAALHLVVTKGHQATTMDAVAEQAGVTKPVVYSVFASRAALLAALLRREQEQALQQLLAIVPGQLDQRLGTDPADLVAHVLDDFLRAVREAPDRWFCIVMPMPDMPPEFHGAREHARALAFGQAERMASQVLRAIGAPADLSPDIVAHTVITLFEMAARLILTEPDRFHPDRLVNATRAAFGLVQGPASRLY